MKLTFARIIPVMGIVLVNPPTLIPLLTTALISLSGLAHSQLLGQATGEPPETVDQLGTQKCCSHSVNQVASPSPVRTGTHSYKLMVLGEDPGVYPHHRAEIFPPNNMAEINKIYWHGWSTFIPNDWENDSDWVLVTQWHSTSSGVMQPLQLQLINDQWCWVNWIGRQPNAEYNVLWCENFTYIKDQWVDWTVNVKWSNDVSGFIKIWKNGELIVNVERANIFENYVPYWKVGLVYPASSNKSHTIYVDELYIFSVPE